MATSKSTSQQFYMNNPSLKAARVQVQYTQLQLAEYVKCSQDPVYFIENYVKLVSLDHGSVLFKLYPYQARAIDAIHNNRKVLVKLFRQAGKSAVIAAYITWYVIFNDYKNVAILANKASIAREIFSRVQFSIENLPHWLQQGVVEWNKTSFELENKSKCFCAASSPSAIRGKSINFLLCDEFAHLPPNLASEFIASVFPTISSSQESKLVLVSTPKGMNEFHKLWTDAENNKNGFVTCTGHWTENPSRNQKWADEQRAILGDVMYAQEILVQFNGSSKTLISGDKLGRIPTILPLSTTNCLSIYALPEKDHSYVISVDTSRGQHLDFSAFVVIDITTLPYKVVATFKDNKISTMAYPFMIWQVAKQYNDAYCLIEINDAGQEVANTMFYEYEYENVYFTHKDEISEGGGYPGVRTTKRVKQVGCSVLKDLIENDQLEINSHDILQELARFSQKGASYAAEDTSINDDLCACLFLFGYLTKQELFLDLTDVNIRKILAQKTEEYISEQVMPVGFHSNGFEDMNEHSMELDISEYGGSGVDPLIKWMNS